MKKIKRMLALALAVVMTMAMSTVAFAAETKGSITVKGLASDDVETVKIYRIATATNTGKWDFNDEWVTETMYEETPVTDDEGHVTNYSYTFNWSTMESAVSDVVAEATMTCAEGQTQVIFQNLEGAAYLVLASGGDTTYAVMGATPYTYDNNTGAYKGNAYTVNAKVANIPTTKTADDKFVHAGETVTFTITAKLPAAKTFGNNNEEVANTFKVYDKPERLNTLTLTTIKIGNDEEKNASDLNINLENTTSQTIMGETGVYTIDLSSLLEENEGKTVILTLTGVVNGDNGYVNQAWNEKSSTDKDTGKPSNPSKVTGYTGDITLTKYAAGDVSKTLAGAKFKITHTFGDAANGDKHTSTNDTLKFVKQNNLEDGTTVYMYTTDATGVDVVEVGDNGKVKLIGLDEGTYSVEETEAPEGYAINTNIPDITITADETANVSLSSAEDNCFIADTTLTSLPFTGGMGTTLFTVLGVAIMVVAAALYFASKKKNNNK